MTEPIEDLTVEQRTELAKLYFGAAQMAASEYDQRVFWLIAGVAGVFGYLQSQLPSPGEWSAPCLLAIGWVLLFTALASVMVSFLRASSTHLLWARYWLWDDKACGDKAASSKRLITIANWVSFLALFAGIAFNGVFLLVNYW